MSTTATDTRECTFPYCIDVVAKDQLIQHWEICGHDKDVIEMNERNRDDTKGFLMIVTKSKSVIYLCRRCVEKFRSFDRYREHIRDYHGARITPRKSTGGQAPKKN